jgi:acyl carrier protein phosphodiesterase
LQTNLFGLKPRINIQQFFKYGYAEQKMMMCVDTINRVKQLAKEIRINSSLSSSRKMTVRQTSMSGERMSQIHSPLRNNETTLKYKHNTLAEL